MKKLSELTSIFKSYSTRTWLLSFVGISLFLPNGINSLSVIVLALYWITTIPIHEKIFYLKKNKILLLLLISFYLFNAFSILYSSNIKDALFDIQVKLSLFLFPIILLSQKTIQKSEVTNIFSIFSVGVSLFSLIAISYNLYTHHTIVANQELSTAIGMHASYFALYASFSFFIVFDRCISEKFSVFRTMLLTILGIIIILLASRIILIGTLCILFIWFAMIKFNLKLLILNLFVVMILVSSSLFYPPVKERFYEAINFKDKVELNTNPDEHRTLNKPFGGRAIRVAVWQCSIDVIKENWLLGVGIGDAQDALQESYKKHAFEFAWRYNRYNAHNLFIQAIISCGIIGLLSVLTPLMLLIKVGFQHKNLSLISFGILFLLISTMESSLNVQSGVVFFALFSNLFASDFLSNQTTSLQ